MTREPAVVRGSAVVYCLAWNKGWTSRDGNLPAEFVFYKCLLVFYRKAVVPAKGFLFFLSRRFCRDFQLAQSFAFAQEKQINSTMAECSLITLNCYCNEKQLYFHFIRQTPVDICRFLFKE